MCICVSFDKKGIVPRKNLYAALLEYKCICVNIQEDVIPPLVYDPSVFYVFGVRVKAIG